MKVETYQPRQCHAGEFVHAQSLVTINRAVDESRIIEGIASTPATDRYGDIVEPEGAVFRTPLPLLVNHNPAETVGQVLLGAASVAGITFRAQLAKIEVPGPLKDRVDGAWQAIKAGLLAHVSIGFRALKTEQMHDGGIRYLSWEWLELSLTPLPANPNARIENVRGRSVAELIELELQLDRADRPRRDYSQTRVVRLRDDG
ncbi:HK97 family phage prohead protease [Paraburkholderia youngii]|uniref:HK97 family phage prohead protease n=1 Tax=Paraburkholderia youngii TaxID=2782701 RepID=UPI003D1E77AB